MANLQTESDLRILCEWVAAHPKCSRGEIYSGLKLRDSESPSTIYRRLELAIQRGFIHRTGVTSNSSYEATDNLRIEMLRKHLSVDLSKRSRVGYNFEWIDDYEPNKSSYLSASDIARLHVRCLPGSAPLSKLDEHDVSMFMCDLSYASSRLEGNEYDHASTIALAEHHIEKSGGSYRDKVMILNHRDAARFIIDSTKSGDKSFGINQHVLRGIHSLLSQDLLKDPMMCGSLRTGHVEIYQSSYIPLDRPELISACFDKITVKAAAIKDPFEQAFFLLVHLPYLQPFQDCNKRTSRVICNIPLLRGGVTPISWMDATNRPRDYTDAIVAIYELNDTLMLSNIFVDCFMRSAERFSLLQREKNPDPVAARYRPEIKACIRARVLEGVESISPNVAVDDIADFIVYIDQALATLQKNEVEGVRYGLTKGMVADWKATLIKGTNVSIPTDDVSTDLYERMRA